MSCSIQLPDGKVKTFPAEVSGLELARSVGKRLAEDAVGFQTENSGSKIHDIRDPLKDGDNARITAIPSKEALEVIRHSAAHVMAQAVQRLWPEVKVTVGPVIENGFYYDFDTDKKFTPEDLTALEEEMKKILKEGFAVTREVWPQDKALKYFESKGETLKQEIIRGLNEEQVSIYKQGDWLDLCRGPHVQRLSQIGAVKVLSHSGAYWRGDSKNKQLQRIYGSAFHSQKDLRVYLKKREQAISNDHRLSGKKLNLFWFNELSPGSPFFTPSGTAVYHKLQNFLREKYKEYGYEEVISPQIYHSDLFESSGHLRHFADNMYAVLEKTESGQAGFSHFFKPQPETEGRLKQQKKNPSNQPAHSNSTGAVCDDETKFPQGFSPKQHDMRQAMKFLKPMNCPGHCLFYKKDKKSYRDLPYRLADFGRLHRNETGGSLHGLTRVRSFCQDDAHVFCRMEDLTAEIQAGIKMLRDVYQALGLSDYQMELSDRPSDRMGEEDLWDRAEQALKHALNDLKIPYKLNPGEGAFYGPKLDIHVKDSFDRSWQLGTFQCDFNLPKAFDLKFVNEKGEEERPVLMHRALLGSLERFIGVYLGHRRGRLPLWLCPLQAAVLPLTDREHDFSDKIQKSLAKSGIICETDKRNEKISYKIRQAQLLQVPYMIIIGKQETESGLLSLRLRSQERLADLPLQKVQDVLLREIQTKSLSSLFSTKKG